MKNKAKRHSVQDRIKSFLEFLSGAESEILSRPECRGDRRIHQAIGMTIAITGTCAFISASYAFYSIFKVAEVGLLIGAFWGFAIAMIDRFLIMTTVKKSQFCWSQFAIVASRIAMATLIAIVISKPLEIAIFGKEIQANIAEANLVADVQRQQTIKNLPESLEINRLRKDNDKLQAQSEQLSQKHQQAFRQAMGEAEGTSGTNKPGKGPVYEEKQKELKRQEKILNATTAEYDIQIKANQQQIKVLEKTLNLKIKQVQNSVLAADGILGQMQMLHKMAQKDASVDWASRLISAIFVAIDVLPLLGKITMPLTGYDALKRYETTKTVERQAAYTKNLSKEIDQEIFHRQTVQEHIHTLTREGLADTLEKVPESRQWKNALARSTRDLIQHASDQLSQAIKSVKFPKKDVKRMAKRAVKAGMPSLARQHVKSKFTRQRISNELEDIAKTAEQALHEFENHDN
jgi:hypothetical protein